MSEGNNIDKEIIRQAWQKHNREHFQSFRKLDIRTKLSAVEGMADVVRRFQKIRNDQGDNHSPE